MKSSAKRTIYFHYPVELVWKSIGTKESREVDPLTEEQFAETEPPANMVYTKALEVKTNEVFDFRMKTQGYIADLRIELESRGPCETKVVIREAVEYRTVAAFLLARFGLGIRDDLRSFSQEMHKRLADMKF